MMRKPWIAVLFILASCNFPTGTETPRSPLTPDAPPSGNSTPTVIPIETFLTLELPTVKPTLTPSLVVAFPKEQPVNCRFGPGTSYAVVGELRPGRQAEIIGKSPDFVWWYVRNPSDPSTNCWLAADFTNTEGDVGSLPFVNPPEVGVTAVTVSIEPPVMNVACDSFPRLVTISAEITTTGPANVIWMWMEESTGDASAEMNALFEEGGTKTVQDFYQVRSARDYTMVVQTILPNIVSGQATFKAVCTP